MILQAFIPVSSISAADTTPFVTVCLNSENVSFEASNDLTNSLSPEIINSAFLPLYASSFTGWVECVSAYKYPVFLMQALTADTAVSTTDSTDDEPSCESRSDILTVLSKSSVI